MRDFFLNSPWPGVICWALIYISDLTLTITCARLYRRNLSHKVVFEGSFELNPVFQKTVNAGKYWSPRFLLSLLSSSTLIAVYWAATMPAYPANYTFLLGALLSAELAVHVRHLGNLYLFSTKLTADHLSGRMEHARPLILRMSSVQLFGFAILFAVSFALTGSWFTAGGMFACTALATKHWILALRASAKRASTAPQPMANSAPSV